MTKTANTRYINAITLSDTFHVADLRDKEQASLDLDRQNNIRTLE